MMEELETSSASTLIYRQKESDKDSPKKSNTSMSQSSEDTKQSTNKKEDDDDDKLVPLATFRSWKKLPHRISLWVFKFDPSDPSDLKVSKDGGFPRPDLLPMADIFRSDE